MDTLTIFLLLQPLPNRALPVIFYVNFETVQADLESSRCLFAGFSVFIADKGITTRKSKETEINGGFNTTRGFDRIFVKSCK